MPQRRAAVQHHEKHDPGATAGSDARKKDSAAAAAKALEEPDGERLRTAVFYWVDIIGSNGEPNKDKTITAHKLVKEHGVARSVLTNYVNEEMKEFRSCKGLPFTLLVVFAYSSVVITHDNAPMVNSAEDSIGMDLMENANFAYSGQMGHKGPHDVNSIVDFWSWLYKGFIPVIFTEDNFFSIYTPNATTTSTTTTVTTTTVLTSADPSATPANASSSNATRNATSTAPPTDAGVDFEQRYLYLHYNRIVGGIRFSQERFEGVVECPGMQSVENVKGLRDIYGMPCVGGQRYELDPEMWDARATPENERTRVEWIYIDGGVDRAQAKVLELEIGGWIDKQTRKVEVAIPIFNAEYGIHVIIYANFFFSRGGHIWKDVIPLSVFANWHTSILSWIWDMLWCACLLWMIYVEIHDIYKIARKKGMVMLIVEYANIWSVLSWFSVLAGGGIIVMFAYAMQFTTELNEAAALVATHWGKLDWNNYPPPKGSLMASKFDLYYTDLDDYIAALEHAVHYNHKFRLVMAAYPLVIIFRLFKAFSAQPRLAVVTSSLKEASVDLFHFMIVFFCICGIYGISGVMLFGRLYDEYTTIQRTFNTVFLTMQGSFDWDELRIAGRMFAGTWFCTFMVIVTLVMLNMLLAIVMDAYASAKAASHGADTLWAELLQLLRRSVGESKGELIPMLTVIDELTLEVRRRREAAFALQEAHELERENDMGGAGDDIVEREKKKVEQALADAEAQSKEDIELDILTVPLLQEIVGVPEAQAEEMLMSAAMKFYESKRPEATWDDLEVSLQDLLFGLDHWQHAALIDPSHRPGTSVSDVTYMIRCKVEPHLCDLWKPPEVEQLGIEPTEDGDQSEIDSQNSATWACGQGKNASADVIGEGSSQASEAPSVHLQTDEAEECVLTLDTLEGDLSEVRSQLSEALKEAHNLSERLGVAQNRRDVQDKVKGLFKERLATLQQDVAELEAALDAAPIPGFEARSFSGMSNFDYSAGSEREGEDGYWDKKRAEADREEFMRSFNATNPEIFFRWIAARSDGDESEPPSERDFHIDVLGDAAGAVSARRSRRRAP